MAKKIFTVHRNCYATIDIEVIASSEEEAIKIANRRFDEIPAKEYYFTENAVEIIDSTPFEVSVDDLAEEAASKIISKEKERGDYMYFGPVQYRASVTVCDEDFGVPETVEKLLEVDSAMVDGLGYIMLCHVDSDYDDIELTDLDENDQVKVLNAILERQ